MNSIPRFMQMTRERASAVLRGRGHRPGEWWLAMDGEMCCCECDICRSLAIIMPDGRIRGPAFTMSCERIQKVNRVRRNAESGDRR